MLCACVTPPSHPTASASATMTTISKTEAKTVREDRRKPALANSTLRKGDQIRRTMKCRGRGRKVHHGVRRTGIPVTWLTDAAWIQERAGRERIWRVVGDTARLLV